MKTRMQTTNFAKALSFHYAWVVLAVGTLVVFGALGLARFGYTMVLAPMQSGLGLSNTHAGGLATANLIGYLVLSVVGGALAAHFPKATGQPDTNELPDEVSES